MAAQVSEQISASREDVWAVLMDVERWPEWTASVRSAQLLGDGPVQVGSQARLEPGPADTTALTLEINHSGPLAGLVGPLTGARTRRFIALEATGLKSASEARRDAGR
jgi:hypothetical protein